MRSATRRRPADAGLASDGFRITKPAPQKRPVYVFPNEVDSSKLANSSCG
jgi:hypothetical protein